MLALTESFAFVLSLTIRYLPCLMLPSYLFFFSLSYSLLYTYYLSFFINLTKALLFSFLYFLYISIDFVFFSLVSLTFVAYLPRRHIRYQAYFFGLWFINYCCLGIVSLLAIHFATWFQFCIDLPFFSEKFNPE